MKKLIILFICFIFIQVNAQNYKEIKVVASDRASEDLFGRSVSIYGNFAIVGAIFEDQDVSGGNTLNKSGSVYIYERNSNGIWSETQKLVASDRSQDDLFGSSVSISGNYAIVTAKTEDEDNLGTNYLENAGSAYIFEGDNDGYWIETQKIVSSDRAPDDLFGNSAAISGNYAIIGAYFEDEDELGNNTLEYSGSAYIFERDSEENWVEKQKLVATDRSEWAFFGLSVSVNGNYAVVGADSEGKDASGENMVTEAGAAYIYQRHSIGTWIEIQKIVASDRAEYDRFGTSVSISGDYIIVGANLENEGGKGAAYIFKRGTDNIWNEVQKIEASDRMDADYFGSSVSISGNKAIIGAYLEDEDALGENTFNASGSAYIFEKNSNGVWSETNKIVAIDRDAEDIFGRSVSINGDYIIIGANNESEDINGSNTLIKAGSAYILGPESTINNISNELNISVKIYPNPTKNIVNIDLGEKYKNIKMTVLNCNAQKVLEKEFTSEQYIMFNLKGSSGIYFIRIEVRDSSNKEATYKIMKY